MTGAGSYGGLETLLGVMPASKSGVVATGSAVENLQRIVCGQINLGLRTYSTIYQTHSGSGAFDGVSTHVAVLDSVLETPEVCNTDLSTDPISRMLDR